jgi:hypothetical protein
MRRVSGFPGGAPSSETGDPARRPSVYAGAMTEKADFTPEEWELVREGPPSAGMAVLMAEKGGTFRETWALAKTYAEARKEHGESALLDALVAEKPDVKRYGSPQELDQVGLERLGEAVALLEQKATLEEVAGYKRFVISVAERVAEAHKEQGGAVSDAERAAIERVKGRLEP